MARYRYEELSPTQFENLVVDICRSLLGKGTRGFAAGPDGGRDARFDGTANDYPSKSAPWRGTTIIQSKHTLRVDASFADSDFSGKAGTLAEELPRIQKLASSNGLDHYMLFSNRHLSGNTDDAVIAKITVETGLSTSDIHIVGVEELDDLLREYPAIAERHNLDMFAAPLRITREDLADVIDAMREAIGAPKASAADKVRPRTPLERKNALNEVKKEELEPLRRNYLKDTALIDDFLASPMNQDLLEKYTEAIDELNDRLPHLIEAHGGFMGAWHAIYDILVNHDQTLRRNARLVRSVQFYMYWHCDLGRDEDDDTAE